MTMAGPFVMQAPLSIEDGAMLAALEKKVDSYKQINRLLKAYYEGNIWLNRIGFSVPPKMKEFQTVVGWPAIVVDVIEERLKWKGWFDLTNLDQPKDQEIDFEGEGEFEEPPVIDSETQKFFDDVFLDNSLEAE